MATKKVPTKTTTKKQAKKLMTLEDLGIIAKSLDETIEVPILDGKYIVRINKHFKTTAIKKYIEDLHEMVNIVTKEDGMEAKGIEKMMIINQALIFKNFTSFDIPLNVDILLATVNHFLDTEIYGDIMSKFDKNELDKLSNSVKEYVQISPEIYKEIDKSLFSDTE